MLEPTYESLIDICVSAAMSSIRSMSYEEVGAMMDDSESKKIDEIIENIPQVRTLPTEREMGLVQNKSLAEWNLSQEPKIEEAKHKLLMTYEEALKAREHVLDLKKQLDLLSEERSLDTSNALLQAAAQAADDESEIIRERFMASEIEVEQFLKEFIEKKALSHMRKVKSEKLQAILRQQQYSQPVASSQSTSYPQPSYPVPYPMSSTGIYQQAASSSVSAHHSFWS